MGFQSTKYGTYRERCVALGYSQTMGVDFTENFSPVVNDVTLRACLIISIQKSWSRRTLDVETEFLEGDLEEDICMKMPPGYKEVLRDLGAGFKDIRRN